MSAIKKPKGHYHHGDLRRALLDAALDLLRRGEDVGLREVARRAGVSHAAPYRHFADKDALLAAVAEEGFHALSAELLRAHAAAGPAPLARFFDCGVAYVRFAVDHRAHYRVMFGAGAQFVTAPPTLVAAGQEAFGVLLAIIEEMQRAGVVREAPAHDVALTIWSLEHGLSMLLLDERLGMMPAAAIDERARLVHAALLEGLAPPGARTRPPAGAADARASRRVAQHGPTKDVISRRSR